MRLTHFCRGQDASPAFSPAPTRKSVHLRLTPHRWICGSAPASCYALTRQRRARTEGLVQSARPVGAFRALPNRRLGNKSLNTSLLDPVRKSGSTSTRDLLQGKGCVINENSGHLAALVSDLLNMLYLRCVNTASNDDFFQLQARNGLVTVLSTPCFWNSPLSLLGPV